MLAADMHFIDTASTTAEPKTVAPAQQQSLISKPARFTHPALSWAGSSFMIATHQLALLISLPAMNDPLDRKLARLEVAAEETLASAQSWDREGIARHSHKAVTAANAILGMDIPKNRNIRDEVSVVRETMAEARDLFFEMGGRELLEGAETPDVEVYAAWVEVSLVVEKAFRLVDVVSRWEPRP